MRTLSASKIAKLDGTTARDEAVALTNNEICWLTYQPRCF
jgi:hypothetical protein